MRVLLPATLDEACRLLAETPEAVALAGGTDLLVHWPQRHDDHRRTYLDLSGLAAELRPHRLTADALVLGGLTTYWDVIEDPAVVAAFPLLARAARQVGAVQIQARGTWAGNIANASPAADGVPVLMAYGAQVEMVSTAGVDRIPLDTFYTGYKAMRRRPDQLIRAIRVPRDGYDFERFEKVGSRRAQAIAKVGLAVTRRAAPSPDEGRWRIVASSVAPTVVRCRTVERALTAGSVPDPATLRAALGADVAPIDDLRSTARYRMRVLENLLGAAIAAAPS